MREVFQTIKDLCFEAKRIIEKEHDNSLFHERLFGASVKAGVDAITIEESPAGGKVQNTRGRSQTARLRAQAYKRD